MGTLYTPCTAHITFSSSDFASLSLSPLSLIRMEGGDHQNNLGNGGSRWNPTKEQINMLESLYKQGLRTPTAEQIQQITARLRDYGHIEGKNVFYWFQNHKARQRQKQKQESFAFYNRFLHAPSPLFPPYQNVICSPCYIPQTKNDTVFYQQKVQLPTAPASFKRSRIVPQGGIDYPTTTQRYNPKSMEHQNCNNSSSSSCSHHQNQETLDLFPIHPTGILQSRTVEDHHHLHHNQIKNPTFCVTTSTDDQERFGNHGDDDHPFFDFFCGN